MALLEPVGLPAGARTLSLPAFVPSEALAVRIADAGGSDSAVDAAGGKGTAKRLRERLMRSERTA